MEQGSAADEEVRLKVLEVAQRQLEEKFAEKYFSAPMVNRFAVQGLSDESYVLCLGSAGTVKLAPNEDYRPVSDVVSVVHLNKDFLMELAATIISMFNDEPEQ